MIVSQTAYYVILLILALAFSCKPLYARFIKGQGNKYDAMYLLIVLLVPVNVQTPKIINVTDCGVYTKEVVLFPAEKNGVEMSYGKNTYIFNNTGGVLFLEYHFYGNIDPKEDEEDAMILANSSLKINRVGIDYIFETPPDKISTKAKGVTRTSLICE
jgi:hypothetical protein